MPDPLQPPPTAEPISLPAFGRIDPHRVLAADELFVVVSDKYPVSQGHALIIPRRAVARFMDLKDEEKARLVQWIDRTQQHLQQHLSPAPDGFNLGINDGAAAGQTVRQFHFHIIPRYKGDVPEPCGGIRWVKPDKARYW